MIARLRPTSELGEWGQALLLIMAFAQAVILFCWAFSVLRRKRQRYVREQRGFCPGCGYDLRASDIRCPECSERIQR